MHTYDAAGNNLVVIVSADSQENDWFGEALAEHAAVSRTPAARGLNVVNTDAMSVTTRQKMYKQGGIFSITSTILVVDFLSRLLEPRNRDRACGSSLGTHRGYQHRGFHCKNIPSNEQVGLSEGFLGQPRAFYDRVLATFNDDEEPFLEKAVFVAAISRDCREVVRRTEESRGY